MAGIAVEGCAEFVVTELRNQFMYLFRYNDFIQKLRVEVQRLNEERGGVQVRIEAAERNQEVIRPSVEDWIRRADANLTEANRILVIEQEVQNGACRTGTCQNLKSRYSLGKQAKKVTEDVKQLREECGSFLTVADPARQTGIETIPLTTSGTLTEMADSFSVVGCGIPTLISEFVGTELRTQLWYLFRNDYFIQQLRVEVGSLNDERGRLQGRIQAAERNMEFIRPSVEYSIRRADALLTKANRILDTVPQVQNGNIGTCQNLNSRYLLGKQAKKMTEDVKQLREECGNIVTVADPAPQTGNEAIPPIPSRTREFESRKRKENEIMECLRDEKILMIGICGMGGIGKTTIVDKIGKRASAEMLFEEIVRVVVSQQVDILKIQKQIAESLGLALKNEENVSVRANRLHERLLLSPKKVLLYFDGVWEWLDLEKIGIPPQCKIILTSRDSHVFEQMMTIEDAGKILRLDGLREDESWELFGEKTGSVVDEPHLLQSAVEVAKKCKGLPLALATVGRAMRGEANNTAWEDALLQLRRAVPTNIPGAIKYVYQPLMLSYDALQSKEAKDFFLLCCLFPKDSNIPIEVLVYFGVALQIFSHTRYIREARNRAHSLVEKLKNRSLLMDADYSTCVKMHNVVRDMALSIASRDELGFMVSHYTEAWLENVSPENCTCISLILDEEAVLPKTLKYPRLKALHLEYSKKLPESFFDGMTGLRFLRIRNAKPSPTLRMQPSCESKMICEIGKLVNLEILRLRDSKIEMLPNEIGALKKLKLLDLNDSFRLKKIAPGIVSSLSQLEELGLCNCPIEWEVEERGIDRSNASLAEVFFLRNLSLLDIQIGPSLFLEEFGKQALNNFSMEKFYRDVPISNPKCLRELRIGSLQGLKALFSLEVFRGLVHLTGLEVFDCPVLEEIIELEENEEKRGRNMIEKIIIPRLIFLKLSRLPKIRYFCTFSNALKLPSLTNLTIVECPMMMMFAMDSCDGSMSNSIPKSFFSKQVIYPNLYSLNLNQLRIGSLRTLFSPEVFRGLSNLTDLEVFDCPMLEEIIGPEENKEQRRNMIEKIIIPRLDSLTLSRLPKIRYFCTFSNALELPSLRYLTIEECPMMMTFALESRDDSMSNSSPRSFLSKQVICSSLRELELNQLNFSTSLFSHEIPIASISAFEALDVGGLTNLRKLNITDCSMLEEVIAEEGENVHIVEVQEREVVWNLPKLKELALSGLPRMHGFSKIQSDLKLPLLSTIIIRECPEVKNSLSLGLRCLPKGVKIHGITDPKDASHFFFNKELTEDEDCLNHGYFKFFQIDLSFNPSWPELYLVEGLSNEFFFDGWKNAHGEIEIEMLSSGITYEIVFMIMLVEGYYYGGMKLIINVASDVRGEDMRDKLTEEWIEILGGEFTPSSGQRGQLRFSIAKNNDYRDGILLKGVYIRPKEIAG